MILVIFSFSINRGITESQKVIYKDINDTKTDRYLDIPLVGVSRDLKEGVIGTARIFISGEKEKIIFDKRTKIDESSLENILDAISFAEKVEGKKENYFISFDLHTSFVSGGSMGSSIALGIIALLENKTIKKETIITGAIDKEGNLKETGGIPLKVMIAGESSFKKLIIPSGQAKMLIYEKDENQIFSNNHYLVKEFDLKKYAYERYYLEIREIKNLNEILGEIISTDKDNMIY